MGGEHMLCQDKKNLMLHKKINEKNLCIGLGVLCLFIMIALIVWGYTSPALSSSADQVELTNFHEGWSQQINDSIIPLDDIHDYTPVDIGESLVFTCTLPEIEDDWAFLFYSINKEVTCYVDGVLIQDFMMQEGFSILKTPGNAWNLVELDSDMSGQTFTLVFYSPLAQYNFLCDIYLIAEQDVDIVRIYNIWQVVISACGICLIMLLIFFISIVGQPTSRRRYLLAIAQYFLVILLWLLAELNAYDIFFARPIISYLLGAFFKRLIPLMLLYLAQYSTNRYWHPKFYNILKILAWLNVFVPLILQFTVGISLLELEAMHCAVSTVIDISLLIFVGEKLLHFKKLEYEEYPFLALPILIVSGGIDNMTLYLAKAYHPFLGVWTAIGAIAFSFVTLIILSYINARILEEKIELERVYNHLENTSLAKQLEAHFIFNTLNMLSANCKTNPNEADRGIKRFAAYLRSYLHLIKQKDCITADEELDLVEDYLIMQQMRMDERLNYTIDAKFVDFKLPPFSVHTLVENAIVHGVAQKEEGGIIHISTKKIYNSVEVRIEDTGVGFDTSQPMSEKNIGVENTKRRLEIMSNATLRVESTVGVGTTVVISIPL